MTCSACGSANETGRKFCRECGARLAVRCPSCESLNSPGDKFCGECGSALAAVDASRAGESSATDPTSPDGGTERRLVSVLFVDLVGFTSYSESRDAEDVRAMLSRYFDAASEAVLRHGGSIEKFIGDAVMAVWGTPVAHEDDAERAVRSALEIVDRVTVLGDQVGVRLQARAGVLTGEAVAALDAVDQGYVAGDLVNTASRLQSAAEPGTVLVGQATYRSTSAAIAYEPVDPLRLKGKTEEVSAWRALRVLGERGGSNRGSAPEPPFHGRDEQLRLLKELLHGTGREGRPRLLHLSGVAGIGKSRLVWELQKYVDGLLEDIFWHHGRCPAYGDGISFWAFADMVRSRCGISEGDDDEQQRSALHDCLARFVSDDDERAWLEPHLARLIGLDDGLRADREELFGAWRRFVERVAEHGTAVLVFEDLQWADAGLLDFIESLLEWSRTSPIVVLTMARPELMDRRATWGVGVRSSSTVHLERLADDEIRAMVVGYVHGLPDDGLARLVSRAEGVPMYAVETVRMLADRGVLEQDGERYVVVGELGNELEIPETLHALVAARLDSLPDAERTLVQDAAVAGQSFTVEAVAAISGREADDLVPVLRLLVRKEVLDQDSDPRSPERGQYRFVQSVIREVAYATLSKSSRKAKHLAVARWFEGLGEDDLAGVVAQHYLDAYRADPGADDAEQVAEATRRWLVAAADRALDLGSPDAAQTYSLQALALASSDRDRAELHARVAYAAVIADDQAATWEHIVASAELFRALDDVLGEAGVLCRSGRGLGDPGLSAAYVELLTDVEQRLGEGHDRTHAEVLTLLAADAVNVTFDGPTAVRWSERAVAIAESLDEEDDDILRQAVAVHAWALTLVGHRYEATALMQAACGDAIEHGLPIDAARAHMQLGTLVSEADPVVGMDHFLRSADLYRRIGLMSMNATNLGNAAEMAIDVGRWDVADACVAEAGAIMRDSGGGKSALDLGRATLMAYRGATADAIELLDVIRRDNAAQWLGVQSFSWWWRAASLARWLHGDLRGSLDAVREGLAIDWSSGNAGNLAWAGTVAAAGLRDVEAAEEMVNALSRFRGALFRRYGRLARAVVGLLRDDPDAVESAEQALVVLRESGLSLPHAIGTWAVAAARPPDDEVRRHVDQARAYVSGIGATALVAAFDAIGVGPDAV